MTRFMVEPIPTTGMWTIHDTQTGATFGVYGSAVAAVDDAQDREREAEPYVPCGGCDEVDRGVRFACPEHG